MTGVESDRQRPLNHNVRAGHDPSVDKQNFGQERNKETFIRLPRPPVLGARLISILISSLRAMDEISWREREVPSNLLLQRKSLSSAAEALFFGHGNGHNTALI